MAGILLKRAGHHVRILEQAASSEREGTRAGIGLSAHVKEFFNKHDRIAVPFSTPSQALKFLDQQTLEVTKLIPYLGLMTTWDAIYYRLRANFDGLTSPYCTVPPDLSADSGTAVFETGKRVVDVTRNGDMLRVIAQSTSGTEPQTYESDIVVAADGGNSRMRQIFQPNLQREYAGYVLWRGTVVTSKLSRECLEKIEMAHVAYPMPYSYVVVYTVPGENNRLGAGERALNFVWYTWPSSSQHTREIMTDVDGYTHRMTIPKGKMRPEIWKAQVETAKRVMHPLIAEIAGKIEQPFVSVMSSICSRQAKFLEDRLFFIGDALVQSQPNTGQGTSLAALAAMTLARVIDGKMTADEWERQILETGRREQLRARAFGDQYLCTWFGSGVSALRLKLCMWQQAWSSWWRSGQGVGTGSQSKAVSIEPNVVKTIL